MERSVRAPDGRSLAVEDAGDPAGRPVLVHMGTPNSRHLYGPNVADAAQRGLRLISYDRPGYGGSTPHPGHSVADCAGDVRAICTALEIGRLAMWGISGGGPYLLACAALLPDLVVAAASLASLAPYGVAGLDWFAGMGQDNVDDFRLLLTIAEHQDFTAANLAPRMDKPFPLAFGHSPGQHQFHFARQMLARRGIVLAYGLRPDSSPMAKQTCGKHLGVVENQQVAGVKEAR